MISDLNARNHAPMNNHYKIRTAKYTDRKDIYRLFLETITREKKLLNASIVPECFLEEFVDKAIKKGNMLVVENNRDEVALIGEVHYYHTNGKESPGESDLLKEFSFFSGSGCHPDGQETSLVSWLFGEIEQKHHDVFRVELNTPVCSEASVNFFKKMGLRVEGNYNGRLKSKSPQKQLMLPLSWTNPSFN